MRRVVTHSKPDGDAIASAWLAATYLFPGEHVEVAFVPRPRPGQPAPAADCLVDVGCAFEPERLAFDHKPPAFADRNATCATRLVWEHLLSLGRPVGHLGALVWVVHEGDRSPPGRPPLDLTNDQPLRIGLGGHDYFRGSLADLRLYGRALTAREVADLARTAGRGD